MNVRLMVLEKVDNLYITVKDEEMESDAYYFCDALNAAEDYKISLNNVKEVIFMAVDPENNSLRYLVSKKTDEAYYSNYDHSQACEYLYEIRKELSEGLLEVFKESLCVGRKEVIKEIDSENAEIKELVDKIEACNENIERLLKLL
jgi:hypothetical protein